jgi:hypothetical protein
MVKRKRMKEAYSRIREKENDRKVHKEHKEFSIKKNFLYAKKVRGKI